MLVAMELFEGLGVVLSGIVLFGAGVVGASFELSRRRRRELEQAGGWLEQVTAARVVVHDTEGQSYDGLLLSTHPDGVVLRGAILLDSNTALSGDTFVPRARVLMVQRPVDVEGSASS